MSFLNEAMLFEGNPARSESRSVVRQVILAENSQNDFSRNLKVSLAGDKLPRRSRANGGIDLTYS